MLFLPCIRYKLLRYSTNDFSCYLFISDNAYVSMQSEIAHLQLTVFIICFFIHASYQCLHLYAKLCFYTAIKFFDMTKAYMYDICPVRILNACVESMYVCRQYSIQTYLIQNY